MDAESVKRIISEEYADLVVEATEVKALTDRFPQASVIPINFQISLVNIPANLITNQSIVELGYSVFPATLNLVEQSSQEASGLTKLRSVPNLMLRGSKVLIGIFDTGIDYTNPIFQYADKTTRIAAIWDQTVESGKPPAGFYYGTEYTRDQINQALKLDNPYEAVPTRDEIGHGTMVAGIAGGNEDAQNGFYGIASEAEFVIVKLKPAKKYLKEFYCIPEEAVVYQENDLAFALQYLLEVFARLAMPMAICVAVGTSESSHDGRGTFSNYQALVAATPGIAYIVAVGNEGNARRHYSGKINELIGSDTVEMVVGEQQGDFSMQLWGYRPNLYTVDIISPSGEVFQKLAVRQDEFREVSFVFEKTIIYLDYQLMEEQSGNQLIYFRFKKPVPGIWKFRVYEYGDNKMGYNIWLPMDGLISEDTYFMKPDPYLTVSALGNNATVIAITAYNPGDDSLYPESSRGYSTTNVITPQIAAPGVNIVGPGIGGSFQQYTGTSVAAAYTAGIAALLLEWGIVKNNIPQMSSIEMKILLERGARRDLSLEYPNRDWGYGIMDIYNVFDSLRLGS